MYCTFGWGTCEELSKRAGHPVRHFCGGVLAPDETVSKHAHSCAECGAKP